MSLSENVTALATRIGSELKALRAEVAAISPSTGAPTSGALVDGGSPTTNHTGNLKVDFGGVT